jgi:hypothetical protein
MTKNRIVLLSLAAVALAVTLTTAARAEKKMIAVTKEFTGSVADEALAKDAPAVVTSAKGLEKLWKDWKIADKMPEVDFTKDLVFVSTTRGSRIKVSLSLDTDKGDLQVLGIATRDLAPGFRYVIQVAPKEGVKTVNGKELPKE